MTFSKPYVPANNARNESNRWDERNFSHQKIRRMRAEVLLDCISEVTETSDRFPGLQRNGRVLFRSREAGFRITS